MSELVTKNTLTLHFYLKHFRSSNVQYILEQTGYANITEYEILARDWDCFPVKISEDGYLISQCPKGVDPNEAAVLELSLHHLDSEVLHHIMEYYIGMNLTDYELLYPENNTIYVTIPYNYRDEEVCQQQDKPTHTKSLEIEKVKTPRRRRIIQESSDSEDELEVVVVQEQTKDTSLKPLEGWIFKLNTTTKNSYILFPNQDWINNKSWKVENAYVKFDEHSFVPYVWNVPLEGSTRPLYFNEKYQGWIVSLQHKAALQKAGAQLYEE